MHQGTLYSKLLLWRIYLDVRFISLRRRNFFCIFISAFLEHKPFQRKTFQFLRAPFLRLKDCLFDWLVGRLPKGRKVDIQLFQEIRSLSDVWQQLLKGTQNSVAQSYYGPGGPRPIHFLVQTMVKVRLGPSTF